MAMSDCDMCWETPCSCGHDYKEYSWEKQIKLAAAVLQMTPEALRYALELAYMTEEAAKQA